MPWILLTIIALYKYSYNMILLKVLCASNDAEIRMQPPAEAVCNLFTFRRKNAFQSYQRNSRVPTEL